MQRVTNRISGERLLLPGVHSAQRLCHQFFSLGNPPVPIYPENRADGDGGFHEILQYFPPTPSIENVFY